MSHKLAPRLSQKSLLTRKQKTTNVAYKY